MVRRRNIPALQKLFIVKDGSVVKNRPLRAYRYFGSQGIATPAWPKRPVQTPHHWRLLVSLDLGSSPTPLSTWLLPALSNTSTGPSEGDSINSSWGHSPQPTNLCQSRSVYFTQSPFGGPGGSRTRVQNRFCRASYSDNTIYLTCRTAHHVHASVHKSNTRAHIRNTEVPKSCECKASL